MSSMYIANTEVRKAVEQVERAQQTYSKQPRFDDDPDRFFMSVLRWVTDESLQEPDHVPDSRERDAWLRNLWKKEDHLAGVIATMVDIQKNRGWTLSGGRNQVARYNRILRAAEGGDGWRRYMSYQAESYYAADIGAVTETGRDGPDGPLRALYYVDPAQCRLTGNYDMPLRYGQRQDRWRREDFFRVVSLPSTDEEYHGLGYCAVSRCLRLAKIMIGLTEHSLEKLGAKAPKGLLLLQNIEEEQWRNAKKMRDAELEGKMQDYYGSVAVIAQMGVDQIDAKLVALSQLPDGFDLKTWTDLLMFGYALCFEVDPIELWPVQAGSLGRGRETEIQHQKATQKGASDFVLGFQDQLQMQLPEALLFEFEQRDDQGNLVAAEVAQAWADVAKTMYEQGMGVLTQQEARSLLAEQGVIPPEWTEVEEEATADESEGIRSLKERLLEQDPVRRAIAQYPDEPIVRYQWPTGRTRVLWQRGGDAIRRRWHVLKPEPRLLPLSERSNGHHVSRQEDETEILFQGEDFTITEADVERAIDQGRRRVGDEFAELLEAEALSDEEIEALDNEQA